MPTYRLKDAARQYNLVNIPISGTINEFIDDLTSGGLPEFYSFTIDECASGEAGVVLENAVDYLVNIFGASAEEAKVSILSFFQFRNGLTVGHVRKIPNFFLLGCNDICPEYWGTRKISDSSDPGPETQLSDLVVYAGNGGSHNDEIYLLFEDISRAATEVLGDETPETWGELCGLGTDVLFEVLKTLLDSGPSDVDIYPSGIPQCGGLGVPFTQNEDRYYFPGIVLLSLNSSQDKVIGLYFNTDLKHESTQYGFAGTISIIGEETGVIVNVDGITGGMYKTVCELDLDAMLDTNPETNGLTLEQAYNNPVLRPYIEMIPDPEPEPIGLQATKRNAIRTF